MSAAQYNHKGNGNGEEDTSSEDKLINYRLDRLEASITSLVTLKDIVTRWDERFSNTDFLQWPIYTEKMLNLSKRVETTEQDIATLKKFVYKATGALVIISIIVQLLIPTILDILKPQTQSAPQTYEQAH